jgi:O-methyltransferase involved in polyketide biosynthesis
MMKDVKQVFHKEGEGNLINKLEPISATAFFIAALKYLSSKEYRINNPTEKDKNRAAVYKDLYKDHKMGFFVNNKQILDKAKDLFLNMDEAIKVFGLRHKYMLGQVKIKTQSESAKQIVILGAGFDTTSERKKSQLQAAEVKVFEVDKQQVLDIKRKIFWLSRNCRETG